MEDAGEGEGNGPGYGMRNTQARIQFTCGGRYGISIESLEGKGTTVTILLPYILEE
jgi:two-component system sensor histidine kinase YesM